MKKFLSRKLIVAIGTGIINILIATGIVPPEMKVALMTIVTSLAAVYLVIQGGVDKEEIKLKEKEVDKEIEEIRKSSPL